MWTMLDRLRKARESAGLLKEELAERLEVSRNTIGNYESGKVRPQPVVVKMWALVTGVPVEWIRTGHEPPVDLCAIRDSNPEPAGMESPQVEGKILSFPVGRIAKPVRRLRRIS